MNTLIDQIAEQDRRIRDLESRVAFWRCVAIVLLGLWVILAGSWLMAAPPSPAAAVALALADAEARGPEAIYCHYFLVLDASREHLGAVSYGLNTIVSHSTTPRPLIQIVDGSGGHVVVLDRRMAVPRREDDARFVRLWDSLAERNFYFHEVVHGRQQARVRYADGTTALLPFVRKNERGSLICLSGGREVAFPASHAVLLPGDSKFAPALHLQRDGGGDLDRLADLTHSSNPIMRWDQFLSITFRARTKDDAGKPLLFPGMYYQFRGIDGLTFDKYLELRGGSVAQVAKLRSDERAGIVRRRLNNMPSSIEWFQTVGTRPTLGPAIFFRTRDFRRDQVDGRNHPILNLLGEDFVATECFTTLPNGMVEFTLFDAAGTLQEFAPADVAGDESTPAGNHRIIEAGHSCVRCHGPHDMYQPFKNHVLTLLDSGLNIYGDDKAKQDDDTIDRLAGLYGGRPADVLPVAILTHAKAAKFCVGGAFVANERQSVVAQATGVLSQQFSDYYYSAVTRRQALLELGYAEEVKDEAAAAAVFAERLPPLPVDEPVAHILRTNSDDVTLLPRREDWERQFANIALRWSESDNADAR